MLCIIRYIYYTEEDWKAILDNPDISREEFVIGSRFKTIQVLQLALALEERMLFSGRSHNQIYQFFHNQYLSKPTWKMQLKVGLHYLPHIIFGILIFLVTNIIL